MSVHTLTLEPQPGVLVEHSASRCQNRVLTILDPLGPLTWEEAARVAQGALSGTETLVRGYRDSERVFTFHVRADAGEPALLRARSALAQMCGGGYLP